MREHPDGQYVLKSDYNALARKHAAAVTDAIHTMCLMDDDANAKLAALWRPMESALKDGTTILVYSGNVTVETAFYVATSTRWRATDGETAYPLGWQPLPRPPIAVDNTTKPL
jgi:hypothetical protein